MKSRMVLSLVAALVACGDDRDGQGESAQNLDSGSGKGGNAGEATAGAGGSGGDKAGAGGVAASGGNAASGQGGSPSAGAASSAGAGGGSLPCEQLPVRLGSCQTCEHLDGIYIGLQDGCVREGTIGCVDGLAWGAGELGTFKVRHGSGGAPEACLFLAGLLVTDLPGWEAAKEGDYDVCNNLRKTWPKCP